MALSRRGFIGTIIGAAASLLLRKAPVDALPVIPIRLDKLPGKFGPEWNVAIKGKESIGFAVIDNSSLVYCNFD